MCDVCVCVCVCVCVDGTSWHRLPCSLQRVEIFGRCQVILQRCEELLKKSVAAVRRDLQKIYSGLANVWAMAAKCKQLTQVSSLSLPSSSSLAPACLHSSASKWTRC